MIKKRKKEKKKVVEIMVVVWSENTSSPARLARNSAKL